MTYRSYIVERRDILFWHASVPLGGGVFWEAGFDIYKVFDFQSADSTASETQAECVFFRLTHRVVPIKQPIVGQRIVNL